MIRKRPKKPITPSSRIRSALRALWLKSSERAEALRLANYSCCECGKKKSVAKGHEVQIQVHHMNGTDMERIIAYIRQHLLCPAEELEPLCKECHEARHEALKGQL